MIEGKVWGTTQRLLSRNGIEAHRIVVLLGGYCSVHSHVHRVNRFVVERGRLEVEIYPDGPAGRPDVTVLKAGDSMDVLPGLSHRFCATEATEALEFYWMKEPGVDIVRSSPGGVREAAGKS